MVDGGSPLVQRRRLRSELRSAREAKGLTQDQVAHEMDWSLSKIIRIEGASSSISANDLKALLSLYGITESERVDSLLALAKAGRERSWWSAYRDAAPSLLLQLIEYESVASAIRQFETLFIPGILQTEEYARAVIQNYYDDEGPGSDKLRALVELRVRREGLLNSEHSPSFNFMLDEAAVSRLVGGSSVMRSQLRRLIAVAEKPNVTVEIVPFSAGLHPGMRGPFEIIEFVDSLDKDIVFVETPRGDIISDDPKETKSYRDAFDRLEKASLGPRDSLALLARIAEEMS